MIDLHRYNKKRDKRFTDIETISESAGIAQLAQELDDPEWAYGRAIAAVLDELSPRPREVAYAIIFDELSYRETAEKLGISVNTVSAHYKIALRALRRAGIRHAEEGR
jgi:RNA polymerase sigma factor (sigma-70 family)